MKTRLFAALFGTALVVSLSMVRADDVKSGNAEKVGGPFKVRAITGDHRKGDQKEELCYFCQFHHQQKPAVVMIFTQKADDNLATVVKAVDEVQKSNKDLGTVVVGVSGVADADFERLQETYKLTTPLTIAVDADGPARYELNREAAVTVLVYQKSGKIVKNFAFRDTASAAAKAADIAAYAHEALK